VITRDEAIAEAERLMACARAAREQLAADGGPEAVAEAAHRPGAPAKADIATLYARWQQEEREKRDAKARPAQLGRGAR
jgi:hypothetical protein